MTPRTIRYYVEQGVIPPPGRGRPAEYTTEHIRRLALVRRLKEQYLPLEEIRDTMQRLTLDEVEELLARSTEARGSADRLESASEYIAGVLNQTALREEMKRKATASQHPSFPSPPPAMPAPATASAPAGSFPAGKSSVFDSAPKASELYPAQMEQTGTWQRITVAPGIELHYILTSDARTNNIAAQILGAAREILANDPGDEIEMEEPQ